MKQFLLIILLTFLSVTMSYADDRYIEAVKEYYYNTSDDDSKNSARTKALEQVKRMALEDVGIYVESYLEVHSDSDDVDKQYMREEIKTLSAGIVQAEVIEEDYDGEMFYIKAKVTVDKESVEKSIEKVIEIHQNERTIRSLQNEIVALSDELYKTRKLKSERSFYNAIRSRSDVVYILINGTLNAGSEMKTESLKMYNDDNYRTSTGYGAGVTIGYWVPHANSAIEFSYNYNNLHSGRFKSNPPYNGDLQGYDSQIYYLLTIPFNYKKDYYYYLGGGVIFSSYDAKTEYIDKAGKITAEHESFYDVGVGLKGGVRLAFKRVLVDLEINSVLNKAHTFNYALRLGMMF